MTETTMSVKEVSESVVTGQYIIGPHPPGHHYLGVSPEWGGHTLYWRGENIWRFQQFRCLIFITANAINILYIRSTFSLQCTCKFKAVEMFNTKVLTYLYVRASGYLISSPSGHQLILLDIPGLWLVHTDHVTWILASDWSMMRCSLGPGIFDLSSLAADSAPLLTKYFLINANPIVKHNKHHNYPACLREKSSKGFKNSKFKLFQLKTIQFSRQTKWHWMVQPNYGKYFPDDVS